MQKILFIAFLGSTPFFVPFMLRREHEYSLLYCSFGFYMFLSTLSLSLYHHIRFESVLYANIMFCVIIGIVIFMLSSPFFHKNAPRHMTEAAGMGLLTTGCLWILIIVSAIFL